MIPTRARRWLLGTVAFLAILLLVKFFFADLRYVPSASMAPALLPGDLVLVDKSIGSSSELSRYDVVLFERPGMESQLLKRVIGLPGESVQLVGGDLFVDGKSLPKSADEFFRVAAPIFDNERQPWESAWEFRKEEVERAADGAILLRCASAAPRAAWLFRKIPYLSAQAPRTLPKSAAAVAHDAGMRLDFDVPDSGGTLRVMLGEQGDQFVFSAEFQTGALGLIVSREATGPATTLLRAELPALAAGSRHQLEVGNVDNRLFLRLDGKEPFAPIPYERNTPDRQQEASEQRAPTSPVNLSFAGGKLRIHRLRLFRDADYTDLGGVGVEEPCRLGPGEYFVLGDNSEESEDSRSFGRVRREEIQGKAWRVVFPISRISKP